MARGRKRTGRRRNSGSGSKTPPDPTPESDAAIVDAEFTEHAETAVAEVPASAAQSRGSLGNLYTPSPLALLSKDAFDARLRMLALEQSRIEDVKRAVLIFDEAGDGSGDYGVIPGTKKPSLYQSGAEKFNKLFGLRPVYRRQRIDGDGVTAPHFRFSIDCDLVDAAGIVQGTGGGTGSSWEVKYRYRNAALECPECGAAEIRVSKFEDSRGFYCWRKPEAGHDGCGAQYDENDQRITSQTVGRKENPDPYDLENTVQQMADKRAYVKATRTTHALSNTFTQEGGGGTGPGGGDDDRRPTQASDGKSESIPASKKVVSEGQLGMVRERIRERAEMLKESGISADVIEREICKSAGLEKLDDLPQVQLPDVIKGVMAWEPPMGEGN